MRTAEVQFSEIKLIWSAKYFLGRWTVDGAFGIRRLCIVLLIIKVLFLCEQYNVAVSLSLEDVHSILF